MNDMEQLCTEEDIRQALMFIDASCARKEWVRVGMAIKSELRDTGFALFDCWSKDGAGYNPADVKSTWRSIKSTGKTGSIGIGSLFAMAKRYGWQPDKKELSEQERAALMKQREARMKQRQDEEEAERQLALRWREVYAEVWGRWDELLSPIGPSQYLADKKVARHGLGFPREQFILLTDEERVSVSVITGMQNIQRVFDDSQYKDRERFSFRHIKRGVFLVPMRDSDAVIYSAQIIYPSGKKSFPRCSPKRGLFHVIGDLNSDLPLGIAEGYATAETVHQATGWPVVVAFDVGGIEAVLPKLHDPSRRCVIFADNDAATKNNPGVTSAKKLAVQYGCEWVAPEFSEVAE